MQSALLLLAGFVPISNPPPESAGPAQTVAVESVGSIQRIALDGRAIHATVNQVGGLEWYSVEGTELFVALWNETAADGSATPWYAISRDGGATFAAVTETAYTIGTKHGGAFDPLDGLPSFLASSPLSAPVGLYMVQYKTQALAEYQERVRAAGGNVQTHFVNHTNLVRLSPAAAAEVAGFEFVRAVVPYHPEYRLEAYLLDRLGTGELAGPRPYNLWVFDRAGDQAALAAKLEALGGDVRDWSPRSSLVGALLDEQQLLAAVRMDEVQYVDRYSELQPDNDIVRQFTGTNALEVATGWTGQGVAGEVADTGIHETHNDFQHDGGVLIHGGESGSTSHGTNVHGIVFGDGTANPQWRGVLPNGNQIFADSDSFGWLNNTNPANRANHTAELVDPFGPYKGLFQTNSTGSTQVTDYTTISANMDQIVLDNDVIICQSQSNLNNQLSRPEAWGKNMISVGGINHQDTLTKSDDFWGGASIGPAEDGRIKPDLGHFYDDVTTPSSSSNSSYGGFSGTSCATPCTASHFGLFFQMWHNDVWHNDPTGATPFQSKPHYETAQAAMINTSVPWSFTGTTANLTRVHQGFGAANVDRLYQLRDKTVWRDREPISSLEMKTFTVEVQPGEPELRATMVYRDLPGNPGILPHRINDISLRVTSPLGTTYFGNNGLTAGNASTPGGSTNTVDTKENVWVANPDAGTWTIEVFGADINTDLDPVNEGNNADFSLWVTGGTEGCSSANAVNYCTAGTTTFGCQAVMSVSGVPSATAPSGFDLVVTGAEGNNLGQFFWGANGRQAVPWGTSSSFNCVVPPVWRGGVLPPAGNNAVCDGNYAQDLNAAWTAQPAKNPGAGATVQAQFWFRDPLSSSNQSTALSDAIEFDVCP
jgi:hypothetical protein